jgi:hypothetical protein
VQPHFIVPAGQFNKRELTRILADKTGLVGLIVAGFDKDGDAKAVWGNDGHGDDWQDPDCSYPFLYKGPEAVTKAIGTAREGRSKDLYGIVFVAAAVWVHLHYDAPPIDNYKLMAGNQFPGSPRH